MNDPDLPLLRRLALARLPGIAARGVNALIDRLGSVDAIFDATPAELCAQGVPERVRGLLRGLGGRLAEAQDELASLRDAGAWGLGLGLPSYPAGLAGIHDPPLWLSGLGELRVEDARAVAIVGARRASPGGRELAHRLAYELAQAGVTVVSGLARGIDRSAHEGALAGGGRTLAVLGSGLLRVHPPQHRPLARQITSQGAVLSELTPRQEPTRWTFPQRNRVVAGLSQGVVVVQAGPRSGALITAELALQSGREVLAVPGGVYDPLARGTNALIKDGAHLVETAKDVLDAVFGVQPDKPAPGPPKHEPSPAARLLSALPGTAQQLQQRTGLEPRQLLPLLGQLQLEQRIQATPQGYAKAK